MWHASGVSVIDTSCQELCVGKLWPVHAISVRQPGCLLIANLAAYAQVVAKATAIDRAASL
jgi:hypothetical protein